jgi:hypothetical protein
LLTSRPTRPCRRPPVELARPGENHKRATPRYSLDSLHPNRLRCDRCGHALPVALDPWDGPESLRLLTEDEAAASRPELTADLRPHGLLCPGAWFADQQTAEAMAAPR